MNRKIFCLALCALLFALCLSVEAQQPKKVPRIGYLSPFDAATESARAEGIRLALRELGYIVGQNIAIEYRYTEGKTDRLPELAAELVRLKVEIIVAAGGDLWIRAARNATKTIPVVMVGVGTDPVKAGFIESLSRPGGNVTGMTLLSGELSGKRLELLKEAVSNLARIAVIYDSAAQGTARVVKEDLPITARSLGLTVRSWEVRAADEFETVFAAIGKWHPDGVYVPGGPLVRANQIRIAAFALKSRIPSVYDRGDAVHAGGLMSYEADTVDQYRRVANYVDKILKGAKAADLPVEQPTKFELVFNLKTAKQIGLTIPRNVLARADKVIR
jgi:putative ABC transport system substrate-binding protein